MATVYFDWTLGDDSRTYAQAQNSSTPWKNLSKANTSATSGDTLSLADGTYTMETINFSSKYFYITATNLPTADSPSLKVIMQGPDTSTAKKWTFGTNNNYSVTGIKFSTAYAVPLISYAGNQTLTLSNVDFNNLRIYGGYDTGGIISLPYTNGNLTMNKVRMYKNYRIADNSDPIGNMMLNGAGTSTLTMNNCLIYTDGTGADQFNSSYGIGARWNSGTLTYAIKNLCIYNDGGTLSTTTFGTTGTITYSGKYNVTTVTGLTPGSNGNFSITLDPFVDKTNNDYRPRPSSQLVSAGTLS